MKLTDSAGHDQSPLRVGVAGTGMIVGPALGAMAPVAGLEVAAIFARPQSRAKGEELAAAHGVPTVFTDYEDLLADPGIDAVYVANVNDVHAEFCRRALEAGKHVICEKPFTVRADELRQLAAQARRRQLVLFEAISLLHLPTWTAVRRAATELGGIKVFDAAFCKYSSRYDAYRRGEVAPTFDPAHAGGALYDLNVYNIHAALDLLGIPTSVEHRANRGFNGLDTSGVVTLGYEGTVAVCSAAKDCNGRNGATIAGPDGTITIDGPLNACASVTVAYRDGRRESFTTDNGVHRMTPEFEVFRDLVQSGDLATAARLLDHSVSVMKVVETAQNSTG